MCKLYVGLHQPSDAQHFDAAFVSVNRLRNRKSDFVVGDWIMDSGAFTEIATHGRYRESVVFDLLHTADSMAWSFAARKQGRNGNDYREAQNFERKIVGQERQGRLFFL